MMKETGYQEKIEIIKPWLEDVVNVVKKDLKNEHLKIDRDFCRRYFLGKNANTVQTAEMVEAYSIDIAKGNIGLGEFIASRWLLKNSDIYGFFEEKLKEITPDFETLEELSVELSQTLMHSAIKQFGASRTYLFSVFNSVVFPESIYEALRGLAIKESESERVKIAVKEESQTLDALQKKYDRDMQAMTDRYEKKLSGLQKKYLRDVESLKKQISTLQKKLNPTA